MNTKKTIYIFSSGDLRRKQNTVYFESNKGKKYLPIETLENVMIFGEVNINKRVMEFFSQKSIILHFFNYYDYYIGSFYPREHYNSGCLILRQCDCYNDKDSRNKLAFYFINGAISNMTKNLKYYNSRGKDLKDNIKKINDLQHKLEEKKDINEMMAIEGNIKHIYYRSFNKIIDNKDFKFEKRTKRPPKNYINCMISFLNSMVYTEVLSSIYKTHLDPRIGFLHLPNFRRFSLNLDVAEVFKPVIGDRLIFSLINKGIIKKSDFDERSGGIRFKEKSMKTIVEKYDNRLNETLKLKSLGRKVSYRRLILLELYKLEKHILGEKNYKPFVMEW
ncbi:MAG: type I-B CRISPR-associated endonuclease Cas1b [Atribacterota bacterium]